MRAAGAALWLLPSLLGCGRADPPTPPVPPAAEDAAVAEPGCRPEAARCASDTEAEVCQADARTWTARACPADTICLAGRCPSLATPTARREPLDKARLYAIRGEGALGVWAMSGAVSLRNIQRLQEISADPLAEGLLGGWRSFCAPEPIARLFASKDERQNPPAYAVLAGYLVSPDKRQVQLKAGAAGRLSVWLNGRPLLEATGPGGSRPLRDEVLGLGELAEGVNAITLIVEQSDEHAPAFALRVAELDNRPTKDLLFAPLLPETRCSAGELLATAPVVTPVAGGFDVELAPRMTGVVPRQLADSGKVPLRAEWRVDGSRAVEEIPIAEPTASDLSTGAARAALPVRFSKRGRAELTVQSAGAEVRKLPLWFSGEVHDRIVKLRELAAAAPAWSVPEGSRDSFIHHVGRLLRALAEGEQDRAWLERMTADAESIGAELAAGRDAYATRTGYVYRAYRSRLDGQLQPYVLYVPRSHKPDKPPVPLVLAFHGRDRLPEHALRTVVGKAPDDTMTLAWAAHHLPPMGDLGAIIAAPFGHGNEGPRGMGEEDALRVLEEVRKAYRVDERRISLTGYSLGGTVSFVLPLHYPDLFSASAPLCGYPNLATYESVRTVRHMPWEDVLVSKRYIVNYAENGLHLPLRIIHGGQDGPARSQVVADRYKDLGYVHIFDVQEDLDHNVWDYAYEDTKMIGWLKARRRPVVPERVRLSTAEYRYDRAYWVRLLAMRESLKFSQIDATWSEKDQRVTVSTSNVAEFALEIGQLSPQGGAHAIVDGAELALPVGERTAVFERTEGSWRALPAARARVGLKHSGVAGPLDDVHRHPMWVVYGTQDPVQTEANHMVAEHLAVYDGFSGGRFPVKADTEVNEGDLKGRSVVLVGNPASNKIAALIVEALPVRFEQGALTLRGKRYEGDDVGVSLIHPNPRDPEEYVVLHAGVGYKGTLAARHLPMLSPDWLVYDRRITVQRGELLLDKRVVLDGGFFGDDWK